MNITGLEGLSDPQSIRAEVERGGRFVLYTYCISLLVVSFKRASEIHFIRPGRSAVARGLPYTLVSFSLGWWGFPWGIIYTLESLVKNLGGGTDITSAVLADLAPAGPPPIPAAPPPSLPLRGDAPPAAPRAAVGLGLFRLAALIVGLAAVGWTGVALYRGAHVQAALVNGLATPLSLTLDGETRALAPNSATPVTLSEGSHTFVWTRPDGRAETETVTLSTPFWPRPLERVVAILNPDRTALVYRETTRYYPKDQPIADTPNDYLLHAGRSLYVFPAADYFFEPFPVSLALKNRDSVAKSRYEAATELDPVQRIAAISDDARRDQARALVFRLAELHPDDELILSVALNQLKPEDSDAFFALHLDDRPLRLEWHRAYQHHSEYNHPERDLVPRYRRLAAENPDDGAAAYLAARIEPDPAARQDYLRIATTVARPCAHAYNSLAFEALVTGRFAAALAHLRDAEKAGLDNYSFRANQRDILLVNGRADEALAQIRALRDKDPRPLAATTLPYLSLELAIACQQHPSDRRIEPTLTDAYLDALKRTATPERLSTASARLAATAAYARGDETYYANRLSLDAEARFAVAITRGEPASAAEALGGQDRASGASWLLVYLAARAGGDEAAAEAAYARALAALASESREHRALAARLQAGDADPAALRAELLPIEDKCILATALGHRFPQYRAAYHDFAASLNFKPEFPARFIARQLAPVATLASAASPKTTHSARTE